MWKHHCHPVFHDLHLGEPLHCPPADLSGAAVSFTARPEIQRPLLAVEEHHRASGPQACTAAINLPQRSLLWELSSHAEQTPLCQNRQMTTCLINHTTVLRRKTTWPYCTCVDGVVSLALVNDQASLEELQETGRLLSLGHHHLQEQRAQSSVSLWILNQTVCTSILKPVPVTLPGCSSRWTGKQLCPARWRWSDGPSTGTRRCFLFVWVLCCTHRDCLQQRKSQIIIKLHQEKWWPKARVTDFKNHRKEVSSSSITSWTSRTDSDGAVCPADDVRVSFVKLSGVLHGDFAVIELLDVPGVHGNRLQLHLTSLLQRDDPVPPLDIDPSQQAVDQAVPFQWLTRHQSLGVAGAQQVWRRGHWEGGLTWDRLSRNGKQMVGREVLSVLQVVV